MRTERVEIFSDTTNQAVLRHPSRRFPGVLIQGNSLHSMCRELDSACAAARDVLAPEPYAELNSVRNALWAYLTHYKSVLIEHGLPLPFNDVP